MVLATAITGSMSTEHNGYVIITLWLYGGEPAVDFPALSMSNQNVHCMEEDLK